MKITKACVLALLPLITFAQALDLGAEANLSTQTEYMRKDKKEYISKMTTGTGTVNVRALLIDGTTETTLFAQKQELTDLGESQQKRCFGVSESFELAKKTLNYKVSAHCALDQEEKDRITDFIILAGTIQEFKKRDISLDNINADVIEAVKSQVMSDATSKDQIDKAVKMYIEEKYSIDGKEISLNDNQDEITIKINRKIKLNDLKKEGSVFKKKIVSFNLDPKEMSKIYKITMPLFASEAVDSLELANYALATQLKTVSAEFYNNINITKFSCKRTGDNFSCDSDLKWDLGFKAENKE